MARNPVGRVRVCAGRPPESRANYTMALRVYRRPERIIQIIRKNIWQLEFIGLKKLVIYSLVTDCDLPGKMQNRYQMFSSDILKQLGLMYISPKGSKNWPFDADRREINKDARAGAGDEVLATEPDIDNRVMTSPERHRPLLVPGVGRL